MFSNIIENVKNKCPLVHNITNYVTVNDCANILLSCGGSPIMADDVLEVEEITAISDALIINIGTLNSHKIESMVLAGKKANELEIPVVLDPVGTGASKLRTDTTFKLLKEIKFSVIRGNISEMKTIGKKITGSKSRGVDARISDNIINETLYEAVDFAKNLSCTTGAVIVITGALDIVADSKKAYVIKNGHPMMSKISGTGCMLSSVTGAYIGANENILNSCAAAVCAMGICGEMAYEKILLNNGGTSSFKMYLIDYMSKIDDMILNRRAKVEVK